MRQVTLAMNAGASGFELHGKTTRRATFLARMEALVPPGEFCALIEADCPRAGNGRPPARAKVEHPFFNSHSSRIPALRLLDQRFPR